MSSSALSDSQLQQVERFGLWRNLDSQLASNHVEIHHSADNARLSVNFCMYVLFCLPIGCKVCDVRRVPPSKIMDRLVEAVSAV